MTSDHPNHHRRSIRLKGYDYAREGLYFVTVCTRDRAHLFGTVDDGIMILNDAGHAAERAWNDIPEHFKNVALHEFIVMPNHVHGIIEIIGDDDPYESITRANHHTPRRMSHNISPKGTLKTIGSIVRGFKIGVTKWFRDNTNVKKVWQRGFFDHIIRNDESYRNIAEYIICNPAQWSEDDYYDRETHRIGN